MTEPNEKQDVVTDEALHQEFSDVESSLDLWLAG